MEGGNPFNLGNKTVIHIQEVQNSKYKLKVPIPRHSVIKISKFKYKERSLKAARKKKNLVTYKETSLRQSADFTAETLQAGKE